MTRANVVRVRGVAAEQAVGTELVQLAQLAHGHDGRLAGSRVDALARVAVALERAFEVGEERLDLLVVPAERAHVELLGLELLHELAQRLVVPLGQLGCAVVGNGVARGRDRVVVDDDAGQMRPAEPPCDLERAVARLDDHSIPPHDDGLVLTEAAPTRGATPTATSLPSRAACGVEHELRDGQREPAQRLGNVIQIQSRRLHLGGHGVAPSRQRQVEIGPPGGPVRYPGGLGKRHGKCRARNSLWRRWRGRGELGPALGARRRRG